MNYKAFWDHIAKAKRISLVTHIWPDGDTYASALALKELINENTDAEKVNIIGEIPPRNILNFVDRDIDAKDFKYQGELIVVVDTSTLHRISVKVDTKTALKIDHHQNENEWLEALFDPVVPATGQILYDLAKNLKLKMTDLFKKAVFVSIWTDTEGMTQRNISSHTLAIMKEFDEFKNEVLEIISLSKEEKERIAYCESRTKAINKDVTVLILDEEIPFNVFRPLVAHLANKASTEVFFALIPFEGVKRVSLRSKGNFNVSKIAEKFGGGGHNASAGCNFPKDMPDEEIVNKIT